MNISLPTLSPTAIKASYHLKPLALCTTLMFCLFLGLYLIVLWPAQMRLSEVMAQYEAERTTQTQHQTLRDTLKALGEMWQQLPKKKELTEIGIAIANLAKVNHVHIPGMKYDLASIENGVTSKGAITFQASGAYKSIRRFIYELEKSGPHLFIEQLHAEREKKTGGVAFKIQVGTFFQPDTHTLPSNKPRI